MQILILTFMMLGCFLGAGFVSGREIASYFSRFGEYSILAIILAGILLFVLIYFFLWLSNRTNAFYKFIAFYFGKFGNIINVLFALSLFILTSSMIAGSMSIADAFHCSPYLFAILTIVCSYLIVVGNEKLISKINVILVPIIIITIVAVYGIEFDVNVGYGNLFLSLFQSVNYVLINIVTLGLYILQIGHKYSGRQKLFAAILTSGIITILMLICNSEIIGNNLVDDAMPMLTLSNNISSVLGILSGVMIWCALLTTIVSCVYLLANYLHSFIRNYKLCVFIILLAGLMCSVFGFSFIVNYIYAIIGVVGLVLVLTVAKKEKEIFIAKISKKN